MFYENIGALPFEHLFESDFSCFTVCFSVISVAVACLAFALTQFLHWGRTDATDRNVFCQLLAQVMNW